MQKGGEMGRGSSPSINLQAGARGTHARTHARKRLEVKDVCRCWLCVGRGFPGACICLHQIPGFLLFRLQPTRGFWVWTRASWANWSEGGGNCSLEPAVKNEEACSVCPSSCLWLALSIQPPSPPCPEAHWDPRRAGEAAGALSFPGMQGQEVPLDSCSF